MFRKSSWGYYKARTLMILFCIVKSRRVRWAEHATTIWDKMSAGKIVGSPKIYWEINVEIHLKEADMRQARSCLVARC
jgi:hypothetical protein